MKPINVYWCLNTFLGGEVLRADPPINIQQKMIKERVKPYLFHVSEFHKHQPKMDHKVNKQSREVEYHKCPAFTNDTKNLFGFKSYIDFRMRANDDGTLNYSYDEEFLAKWFRCRSWAARLFDFMIGITFYAPEEKSLMMSQQPAYLEDNDVVNKTIMIPGQFDIAKYQRFLEYAFHLKKDQREITFSRKDILFYLKFHTDRPIRFKRFLWTSAMQELFIPIAQAKDHKMSDPWSSSLEFYYNIFNKFRYKEKLLKCIKENICKDEDEEGVVKK